MQFAVADVEWWRSPWPSHPLLQGVMHRLPPSPSAPEDGESDESDAEEEPAKRKLRKAKGGKAGTAKDATAMDSGKGDKAASGDGSGGIERVEEFLKGRLSVWQPGLSLTELGLDSLDLVSLRNAFQKKFKLQVPMATFTNAQQTLADLIDKLGTKF